MTCREFTDFLSDYIDGDLADAARTHFEAHLRGCRDCETYLRNFRETIRIGKAVCKEEHDAVDDHVPEDLVQAILAAHKGR